MHGHMRVDWLVLKYGAQRRTRGSVDAMHDLTMSSFYFCSTDRESLRKSEVV